MQKLVKSTPKTKKKRTVGIGGFTLIETMIALMLLTVGILGVSKLQMAGMRNVTLSRQRLHYSRVAANYLELMMAMNYGHEWLTAGRHGPFDLTEGKGTVVWEIQENQPSIGLKLIRVTIEYSNQNSGEHNHSLEFLKSRQI